MVRGAQPPGEQGHALDGDEEAVLAGPVADVARAMIDAIGRARTALDAELVVCEMIGQLALGIGGGSAQRTEASRELVSSVTTYAEQRGTSDALATLQVLAALGPLDERAHSSAAAQRVAAAGVRPKPWAARLGRPSFLRAWRYGDVFGEQSSLGVLFDDTGRSHALMVLIDHALGGGLKDAWVGQGREATRMRDRVVHAAAGETGGDL